MSFVQMSLSGAVMILFTVIVRALLIRRLPKRTFTFMWYAVTARLLIPFTLPCPFSAYSLLTWLSVRNGTPENIHPSVVLFTESTPGISEVPLNTSDVSLFDPRTVVYPTGVLICFAFFAVTYVKCRMKFKEALPADNEYIRRWIAEHGLFRRYSVRCSDRISSPLTYGIFRPVILLPSGYEKLGTDDLNFILTHEYTHIRRFDAAFKLALTAAACVHWFNPVVPIMLMTANKDVEISCDEAVLRALGDSERQAYAMTLIRMEERKSGLAPLNGFSGNSIKERIVLIMKFKKITAAAVIAAACLVVGATTAFATSAAVPDRENAPISRPDESIPESAPAVYSQDNEPGNPYSDTESGTPEQSENSTAVPDVSAEDTPITEPETPPEYTSLAAYLNEPEVLSYERLNDVLLDYPPDCSWLCLTAIDEEGNRIYGYLPLD